MISSSDNSGLGVFLIGLIVIVMAGVALSLMADRRFKLSSSKVDLESQVIAEGEYLGRLQHDLKGAEARLSAAGRMEADFKAEFSRLKRQRDLNVAAVAELSKVRASLESELEELGQQYAGYRERTWNARARQIEGELAKTEGQLAVAQAKLAAISARDPLANSEAEELRGR